LGQQLHIVISIRELFWQLPIAECEFLAMCGITGFIDFTRQSGSEDLRVLVRYMADKLRHRGPDDAGEWVDPASGVALGFRRLAILDLSSTGHQPMISANDRFVIVFNGEIYNFAELRTELAVLGCQFHGHSDTEVLLHAVSLWGIEAAIKRCNGMFAIALWDREKRRLYLVRDRLGIKPLYYGKVGGVILFGSELKALRAHPAFVNHIDRNALTLFLRHNYIPTPYCIYEGMKKLLPGSYLVIEANGAISEPIIYWSARDIAENGAANPFEGTVEEGVDALEALLRGSVGQRMIADVPLGAFLSGGVDSSTIVALMQAQSQRPVKTFSIGFWEKEYDEAQYARAVAMHLGTDHTELYVTPDAALDVIPHLPQLYDEPFSDSSQIPTFLVAELARRSVTVSLSGDGGDELFAGYDRYAYFWKLWDARRRLPLFRRVGRNILGAVLTDHNSASSSFLTRKFRRIQQILAADSPGQVYLEMLSHWQSPQRVVRKGVEYATSITDQSRWADLTDFTSQMMYLDLITYLPDDILTKVDRASMGVSLEARVPLLDDHRVVEFAWKLPLNMKVRDGQTKWLLRQVLYRYVPPALIERPKMGFGVPIDHWLRGALREWAETLLDAGRLQQEGYFNPEPVRRIWQDHLTGRANWQYLLWDVLMFQSWLESQHTCGANGTG
jgi:asparagine synthase (glutamine-hydrolysing)